MGVIAWIMLGLIAGVLAKLIMPGRDPSGVVVTMLLGIAGALVGGFLWILLTGNRSYGDLDIGGIIIAVIGSLILLGLYRALVGRRGYA
ncbi:MAG: GlsB/YeaQ/YmgE family stress response membrane protein [Chloroflexota bacterium]